MRHSAPPPQLHWPEVHPSDRSSHDRPQPPQFERSFCVSRQVPPQHSDPLGHAFPQRPQ